MRTVITLPNGRAISAGTYAKAWRAIKSLPKDASVLGFAYFPEPAESVLHAMRGMLSEVINRHDRSYGIGRKWDNDYQVRLWRDSRRLRDIANRIRVYQFETSEARNRFSHLLSRYDD
jgi:hypothetical protein